MIPQIDNSLSDVIKQNKIPNRTYKIVSDTELKTVLREATKVSGESIEIKDNAYSELDITKIYGKSTQKTRSGKNLYSSVLNSSSNVTVDNLDLIIDFSKDVDTYARLTFKKEVGKTYTFVFDGSGMADGESVNFYLENSNQLFNYSNGKNIWVQTADKENSYFGLDDRDRSNISSVITLSNIMILEGEYTEETIPEYEQYGVSPSLEFPSEIKSVGDNVNLVNIPDENITRTKSIDITDLLERGETYSFSGFIDLTKSTTQAIGRIRLDLYVGDAITYKGSNNISPKSKGLCKLENITIGEDVTKVLFTIQSMDVANFNCDYSQIKIQKGKTADVYSEYGKGIVGIKQIGKNLAKIINGTVIHGDNKFNVKNGTLTIETSLSSVSHILLSGLQVRTWAYSSTELSIIPDARLTKNGGNYIFNIDTNYPISNLAINAYVYTSKRIVTVPLRISHSANIALESDEYILNIGLWLNSGIDLTGIYFKFQLEKGTESTDYEPYFEKITSIPTTPLRSLPNGVCDTIEEDGIHRRVGSVVLDGSEKWYFTQNYMYILKDILELPQKSQGVGISTHLIYKTTGQDIGTFRLGNSYAFMIFTGYTDVAEWRAWLQQNPIQVDYELAEEVIEPFDEFENIQNIETLNKRIIYLDAISEVNPDIDAKYYSVENVSYEQEEVSRIMGFVDNLEAIKQSAYHILGVERYSSDIYDFNYGVELEQYIGQSLEYIEATIQDTLQEALTQDERILGVEVTEITQTSVDCVYIKFNLICYLDEIEMEVYINV